MSCYSAFHRTRRARIEDKKQRQGDWNTEEEETGFEQRKAKKNRNHSFSDERTKDMEVLIVFCEFAFAPMPLLSRLIWIPIGSTIPLPSCPRPPPSQPNFFSNRFPLLSSGKGVLSPSIYGSLWR